MSNKIAIAGHPTKGHKVIEYLESLGGVNKGQQGREVGGVYYIDFDLEGLICLEPKREMPEGYTLTPFNYDTGQPIEQADKYYPGIGYQALFNHMSKEHDLTLVQSELQEIVNICKSLQ